MFVDDNPDATLEEILAHHGVKGMKWGVRRGATGGGASGGGGGGHVRSGAQKVAGAAKSAAATVKGTKPDASGMTRKQFSQNRKVDHRTTVRNLEDWHSDTPRQQRNKDIKAARSAWKGVNRSYKDTKHDLKAQVKTGQLGKFAAKDALNKASLNRAATWHKSQTHTTGEAVTHALLGALGTVGSARA